jgi:putative endonuclease
MMSKNHPSPTTYDRGLWAERVAGLYLWTKGYRLRARRFKTPVGEIDLIATRGNTLVFVEVKSRPNLTAGVTAIRPASHPRLRAAAALYVARYPQFYDYDQRFDLMVVIRPWKIHHLDNIDLSRA